MPLLFYSKLCAVTFLCYTLCICYCTLSMGFYCFTLCHFAHAFSTPLLFIIICALSNALLLFYAMLFFHGTFFSTLNYTCLYFSFNSFSAASRPWGVITPQHPEAAEKIALLPILTKFGQCYDVIVSQLQAIF